MHVFRRTVREKACGTLSKTSRRFFCKFAIFRALCSEFRAVMPRLAPGVVPSVGYLVVGDIKRPETIFARDLFVPSCA